jgi:hypothetical protein
VTDRLEIEPEPGPEERVAIEAALELLRAGDDPGTTPWVAAARREAIDDGLA